MKVRGPRSEVRSQRAGAVLALWIWNCTAGELLAQEAEPLLRPPHGELPPTFWEQHGLAVILAGIGLVVLIVALIWWWRRPRPAVVLPPEVRARNALAELAKRPEDGFVLSQTSQILRRYVIEAFALPVGEYTTTEFGRMIRASEMVGEQLAGRLANFLRECDERKFAGSDSVKPTNAVPRASELIASGEARLARLRQPVGSQTPQLATAAR